MPVQDSVFARFAREALRLGADAIEVEYRDGHDEILALRGPVGQELARLPSSGPEATALREELYMLSKRAKELELDGHVYKVRARVYDSFGEDAFHIGLGGRTKR